MILIFSLPLAKRTKGHWQRVKWRHPFKRIVWCQQQIWPIIQKSRNTNKKHSPLPQKPLWLLQESEDTIFSHLSKVRIVIPVTFFVLVKTLHSTAETGKEIKNVRELRVKKQIRHQLWWGCLFSILWRAFPLSHAVSHIEPIHIWSSHYNAS